jgi:hypothetical protein
LNLQSEEKPVSSLCFFEWVNLYRYGTVRVMVYCWDNFVLALPITQAGLHKLNAVCDP